LASTNRWLTAADAYVARYPTKLAFCSRFRRQRKAPVELAERRFSLASRATFLPKNTDKNVVPTKHKKAGGVKTASLRTAR
jgi:hypothetical protein